MVIDHFCVVQTLRRIKKFNRPRLQGIKRESTLFQPIKFFRPCRYRHQIGTSKEAPMRLRNSPRRYVRYSANVQTDNGAAEGTLFDLSATGCRIQSNIALTPGSYLALHFEAPEAESSSPSKFPSSGGTKITSLGSSSYDTPKAIASESLIWSKVACHLSSHNMLAKKNWCSAPLLRKRVALKLFRHIRDHYFGHSCSSITPQSRRAWRILHRRHDSPPLEV